MYILHVSCLRRVYELEVEVVVQLGMTVVKRETAVRYSEREQETTGYFLMPGHCSRPISTFVRMKPLDI